MSCGCGKKKCNGKCGISPSVLQINNNECTLFHKVEIPAVMGDETTNPPKTGAYRNVLLYYEASGNSYLYSSDGIPTKLTGVVSDYEVLTNKPSINGVVLIKNKTLADLGIISAIDDAVSAEATARTNADNALSDRITTNANNIAANATAISNEATARANADNTLSARISGNTTAINNEKTARENADTALSNRITTNANAISAETTARENADSALSDRITTNANNIAANTTAIGNEATARENADTALGNRITANTTAIGDEAIARENADNALSGRITTNATAISNEKTARENADTALSNRITTNANAISAETTARENADTALGGRIDTVAATAGSAVQPNDINYDVLTDIDVSANSSTSIVELESSIVNLKTGVTSSEQIALPVASSTEAGVMNSSTFDAVTANTNNINAIMNGAVAITGLSANPSQSDLTIAWQNETGLSTLINRASVYDVTNNKVWTYYTNDTTWHAASNTSSVTVNTFTNSSEGTIKGSTNAGQVFAENDGTGSVNGWDTLSSDVANAKSKLSGIQAGAEVNVQSDWNVSDNTSDAYIKNKPTIGNATLTIQKNGTTVDTFTANATSNKTVNISVPTKTSDITNDGSDGTSTYVEADNLATVATSGSYNDLSNKPTIGNATLTIQKNGSTVDTFTANATSNKTVNITVPTKTSDITNDSGYITSSALPTVNNGTLTIKKNNTNVATFTANQSGNSTANIEVPTKTSELDNDAGFIANDTHQVCGEGGNITLDTTTFEPLEMNHLGGNTEQQTYVGKNLLKLEGNTTEKGLTISRDATTGALTFGGTTTGTWPWLNNSDISLPAGTYTFSIDRALPYDLYLRLYETSSSYPKSCIIQAGQTSGTATTTYSIVYLAMLYGVASSGTQVPTTTIHPMLESGSTATTPFEPYVGGVPAPSPEYPQNIKVVTGENTVEIHGKNLYKTPATTTHNGVTFTLNDDGTYNLHGTATAQANDIAWININEFEDGATYALSATKPLQNGSRILLEAYNGTTWLRHALGDGAYLTQGVQSIVAPINLSGANRVRVVLRIDNGTTANMDNVGFQLEKSSSVTTFVPYQSQSYEVNLGKNLLSSAWESGKYSDNTGEKISDSSTTRTAQMTAVEPYSTYIVSNDGTAVAMNVFYYRADGTYITHQTVSGGSAFTTGREARFVNFYRSANTTMDKAQLERGGLITSYAPYFTPIELCKIGDYQDYIYRNGEKWYLHKETGKADLSSYNWYDVVQPGILKGTTDIPNVKYVSSNQQIGDAVAEKYIIHKGSGMSNVSLAGYFAIDTAMVSVNTGDSSIFPTGYMFYALATPTDTEITNTALTAQLDALWDADGYDGQTNIFLGYAEGNAQGILSVCQYPSHLPIATKTKLGTIIVGHGLDIEPDGRLDVIIDDALSDSSIHPVQNKVITTELNSKADISSVPTKTSDLVNDSGFVVNDTTEICDEGNNITLNGTLLEPLDVKRIEGATSQTTYTGKNLLKPYGNDSQGVVTTVNGDGSVSCSGTTTSAWGFNMWTTLPPASIPAGTYTFSINKTLSYDLRLIMRASDDASTATTIIPAGSTSVTVTTTAATTQMYPFVALSNSGVSINIKNLLMQLEASSSATAIEPYVGRTTSPNPEYPQTIKTVSGENTIKVVGKNLLKVVDGTYTKNGITVVADNGVITINGTATANSYIVLSTQSEYYDLFLDGSYAFKATSATGVRYQVYYSDASLMFDTTSTQTKSLSGEYRQIRFQISVTSGTTLTNFVIRPQIEKSQVTDFEPYSEQSFPLKLNAGINYWDNLQSGFIPLSGPYPTSNPSYPNAKYGLVLLRRGQSIRTTFSGADNGSGRARWINPSTNEVVGVVNLGDYEYYSSTHNFGDGFYDSVITANKDVIIAFLDIGYGYTQSDFAIEPINFDGIELYKIGTYQDYIYKDGEKWYVHKEINRGAKDVEVAAIASDNTASPTNVSAEGTFQIGDWAWSYYASTIANARMSSNIGTYKLDTSLVGNTQARAMTSGTFCQRYGTNDRVYFRNTAYIGKTGNEVRAMLLSSGGGADFAWTMATPTDTEITNETLIAQLNAITDADGYEGQTTIFSITSDINEHAILSVCQYPSHLPIATKTKLGTVVVGHGLDIEADGKLDVIVDDDFSTESDHPVQNKVITNALAGKADNTDLSTVAMTGSYDDLTGKPTIPTVNNATLTIQKNGTNVATFTANSSTNVTANITAPVVTMTTTDPGEGGALAANNFIGVYV